MVAGSLPKQYGIFLAVTVGAVSIRWCSLCIALRRPLDLLASGTYQLSTSTGVTHQAGGMPAVLGVYMQLCGAVDDALLHNHGLNTRGVTACSVGRRERMRCHSCKDHMTAPSGTIHAQ